MLDPPSPVTDWHPATEWYDVVFPLEAPSSETAVIVWSGMEWEDDCYSFQGEWYAMAVDEVRPVKP